MSMEDYYCDGQMSLFNIPRFKIDKPIRLIELFAGIGTQAMALRYLGADFEPYKISEWEYSAVASYKEIHFPDDHTNYSEEVNDELLTLMLHRLGISSDGKEPMTREQITRLGTHNKRIIYNNFKATHNLGSITNIGGGRFGNSGYRQIVLHNDLFIPMPRPFGCRQRQRNGERKRNSFRVIVGSRTAA